MALRTLEMPEVRFEGLGRCIFCLSSDKDLTIEHVIPLALSGIGEMYMRDGSCSDCNGLMNTRFENNALQYDFCGIRALLELKRRKKRKPLKMPEVHLADDHGQMLEVSDLPLDQFPAFAPFVSLPPPGMLSGEDRGSTMTSMAITFVDLRPANQKWQAVDIRWPAKAGAVPLMVAKIAYSYAVAIKGLDAFNGEGIRDLLQGRREDIYNFVGGASKDEHLPGRYFHQLMMRRRNKLVTVIVHLFASFGAPAHEVVVGEASG